MADWQPDILGDGYEQQVLELGDDPDGQGQIVGTLVRRTAPANPIGAVLYVHGFTDYFFSRKVRTDHSANANSIRPQMMSTITWAWRHHTMSVAPGTA